MIPSPFELPLCYYAFTGTYGILPHGSNGSYTKSRDCGSPDHDRYASTNNDGRRGVSVVELVKKEGSTLGLTISGGTDKGCKPKISNIRPGSIAHRSDCLAVGDHIISVNGIRTSKLKHDEIVTLLKNAGDKVTLEVEYEIPFSCSSEQSLCLCPKVIQLQLEKENGSFGFTLRGGACGDKLKCRPLLITHVRFGGPANREGSIKSGDRLLAVDGINLTGATLQEALNVLKQVNGPAIFTIEYDVSVIDAVRNASGPLLVEIDRTPGVLLGISLTCLLLPEPAIVISSIRQASVAERCGALHVGDHVLAIDGVKVDLMTAAEAMQLLKSSSSETVKLEILPISQIAMRSRVPETSVKRGGTIPHYMAARASYTNSCYNTLSSIASLRFPASQQHANMLPLNQRTDHWNQVNGNNSSGSRLSPSSSNASLIASGSSFPSIGHADRTEVTLTASHKGFGFTVQYPSLTAEMLTSPPVISCIECGSPAEKSGVLQVGDRILAVNSESTKNLTLDEILQLIAHSHPKVTLKTEFDVAESVVPSSGTFVVKLARGSAASLGITVTAPKNRQAGEPLIISAVERGSVAHRSGTIQPGDKLLAVDMVRMESCTAEDAFAILQSCNEITTLRIRKDETFCDDPDANSATVYTVELARHGGPLGITVSGTEEPFDPIMISGLTENGLAERTGALHVGDRILAINGVCLRGKPLSEAIQILQSCADVVTLKISRNPELQRTDCEFEAQSKCTRCTTENQGKTFTTPLPSVDSAVESWDSCNMEAFNNTKSDFKQGGCSATKSSLSFLHSAHPAASRQSFHQANVKPSCEGKRRSVQSLQNFSSHPFPSDEEHENWSKVLEDLETCGQSQLIRQIERTILGNDECGALNEARTNSRTSLCNDNVSKCPSDAISEQSLQELNAQIEQLGSNLDLENSDPTVNLNHLESVSQESVNHCSSDNSCHASDFRQRLSPSFPIPVPIEVHKVTLFKDQVYEDFGFSVSDGLYDRGVYINCIRAGGPADLSGLIKPYDRILQVNNVKTYNYDCCLTVPLIASSGDRIELVISRPAYETRSSSESTLGRACGHHPWVDDTDREASLSPFPSRSDALTVTKTL